MVPALRSCALLALVASASPPSRSLSLPKSVAAAGGLEAWNRRRPSTAALRATLDRLADATKSVGAALAEVAGFLELGDGLWAHAYLRAIADRAPELYFAALLAAPEQLLPIAYTPTVGEACQRFGRLPFRARGCYVSLADRGRFAEVLREYAAAHLRKRAGGGGGGGGAAASTYECDCVVFTDGGRVLGLGDLGAWAMGIPLGKLDLYAACAGVDPRRTVPVVIDAGVADAAGNTAGLDVRGDESYTGARVARATRAGADGAARLTAAYYAEEEEEREEGAIDEFMRACVEVFGDRVLLQFEDFNSNDAFPLLARARGRFLCYNDDIQGTAAVTCAAILGAIKLRHPGATDLLRRLRDETVLFHGAGSANLGAARLLVAEGGLPRARVLMTNSRGLVWRHEDDDAVGNFRTAEQAEFAVLVGEAEQAAWANASLAELVARARPSVLVGAVGVAPACFTREVVEAMVAAADGGARPVVFALSNPSSQAECTSAEAYEWSGGRAIFGSGTAMRPVVVNGTEHVPGQVNNVYVFPGVSLGAIACEATSLPDRVFLVAAEAVANSLSEQDVREDRVVPALSRIRAVSQNVATAVVLECQKLGLARAHLGSTWDKVHAAVGRKMWTPKPRPHI